MYNFVHEEVKPQKSLLKIAHYISQMATGNNQTKIQAVSMVSRAPTKASANNQLLCKLRMSKIKWNGF